MTKFKTLTIRIFPSMHERIKEVKQKRIFNVTEICRRAIEVELNELIT